MREDVEVINSYRDLLVWKAAVDLAVACYEVTQQFPKGEMYGMTSQIRRAAAGVAANIAEGYGRGTTPNFIQFLKIAQGSLKELETHVIISGRVQLLNVQTGDAILNRAEEIGKMLRTLIRRLQEKQ